MISIWSGPHTEKTYKTGMSASLGGVGAGAGVTVESSKPMENGQLPSTYSTEVKVSLPGITGVPTTEDGHTSTGVEHEIGLFKFGWYFGVEGSLSINVSTNTSAPNVPVSGDPIASDKTSVQIYLPDNIPTPKK